MVTCPPTLKRAYCEYWLMAEFYRVGGHIPVKVDVRIIAATHKTA